MILLFLGNLFINVKTLEILGGFAPLAPHTRALPWTHWGP